MKDLHWTEAGFFGSSEDEMALHHAIARYHAFVLALIKEDSGLTVALVDFWIYCLLHQRRSLSQL